MAEKTSPITTAIVFDPSPDKGREVLASDPNVLDIEAVGREVTRAVLVDVSALSVGEKAAFKRAAEAGAGVLPDIARIIGDIFERKGFILPRQELVGELNAMEEGYAEVQETDKSFAVASAGGLSYNKLLESAAKQQLTEAKQEEALILASQAVSNTGGKVKLWDAVQAPERKLVVIGYKKDEDITPEALLEAAENS